MRYCGSFDQVSSFYSYLDDFSVERLAKIYVFKDSSFAWGPYVYNLSSWLCVYFEVLESFQEELDIRMDLSTAFHPQMDGQSEWTTQVIKDML